MAICTRWGTPVKVVSRFDAEGWVTVEYEDGERRTVECCGLKADGGYGEIEDAANAQTISPVDANPKLATL